MTYRIELHPEALLELKESYQWYQERSDGLGLRFMGLINRRINEIAINPEIYTRKKGNYREALMDVFPYVIIYEILKKEGIVFISYVFHTKRNPRLKYKR
ncbi:MAG: type II toxin-antitoxin system RelE/ParE family toxin [Chitinophagales bacterium]